VGLVVRHPTGRFGGGLPEERQDRNGDGNQDQVAFFERKSHVNLEVWLMFVLLRINFDAREKQKFSTKTPRETV
jgi:hypothetical protein